MKLSYCQSHPGNFGDELNGWLWRELLPADFFDGDDVELFYGIGTILSAHLPRHARKIIFGAGTGYKRPPVVDDSFHIFFVRGPLTARALGLLPQKAIADPAYLILNTTYAQQPVLPRHQTAVIPHHLSLPLVDWQKITQRAGLNLIQPTDPLLDVITRIRESRRVLTESLHGAILADAFRVPWIPIVFSHRFLDFKWQDWCESIAVKFAPVQLPPRFQGTLALRTRAGNFIKNRLGKAGLGPARWQRRPFRQSSPAELEDLTTALRETARTGLPNLSSDQKLQNIRQRLTGQLQQLQTLALSDRRAPANHHQIQPPDPHVDLVQFQPAATNKYQWIDREKAGADLGWAPVDPEWFL